MPIRNTIKKKRAVNKIIKNIFIQIFSLVKLISPIEKNSGPNRKKSHIKIVEKNPKFKNGANKIFPIDSTRLKRIDIKPTTINNQLIFLSIPP